MAECSLYLKTGVRGMSQVTFLLQTLAELGFRLIAFCIRWLGQPCRDRPARGREQRRMGSERGSEGFLNLLAQYFGGFAEAPHAAHKGVTVPPALCGPRPTGAASDPMYRDRDLGNSARWAASRSGATSMGLHRRALTLLVILTYVSLVRS